MSSYKEDIKEAKERWNAWWDHELIDRPCISYWGPRPGQKITAEEVNTTFDFWCLAKNWDAIDHCMDIFDNISKKVDFGGENIPSFFPNYGPGIMASVLGVEPVYKDDANTVWFSRETSIDEIVSLLESAELNNNNPWYERLTRITEIAARRAGKDFCVAMTDLGGVLDILSSFLGPEKLIINMKRHPDIIDSCREIILEKLLKMYDDLQAIIEHHGDGCMSWMPLWCSKRWYPLQCDFSAMLNPNWFKRIALPDIIAQAEHMDYSIYHLDGPYALKFLDDLLNVPSITGIQWVPGAGIEPTSNDRWIPIYKKVQAAGKSVVMDLFESPKSLTHFYTVLDPKKLWIQFFSLDSIRLHYYLPKFIGGQGSQGNYRQFRLKVKKEWKSQKS
jgi:5-methyltetrahydrofolate--homocysteine methyltransferase